MFSNNILVKVQNISVKIQGNDILDNISLDVERGRIVTLIGPNGAGKSTLVRIVLGLLKPNSGNVFRQDGIRIGYMPQHLSIDPILPITVMSFLRLSRVKTDIKQVVAEVGISHLLDRPIQKISGGEMQRVLLARALLREPDLLVLDEPIQGVDLTGQSELYELIGKIRQQRGCGILMVSHDLHLVMAATDYVVCLNKHLCCSGHPEVVTKDPAYLKLFGTAIYTHKHKS
jgi:zinc transport system ATP-binding protein